MNVHTDVNINMDENVNLNVNMNVMITFKRQLEPQTYPYTSHQQLSRLDL